MGFANKEKTLRNCPACSKVASLEFFNKRNDTLYHAYCKECMSIKNKINHKKSWPSRKERHMEVRELGRAKRVQKLIQYLASKQCVDCGENDIRVLEFDHLHDKEKNVSEAVQRWSWARTLKEISKCEIRCANCHRVKTQDSCKSWRSTWQNAVPVVEKQKDLSASQCVQTTPLNRILGAKYVRTSKPEASIQPTIHWIEANNSEHLARYDEAKNSNMLAQS